jgi:hypothetical protein
MITAILRGWERWRAKKLAMIRLGCLITKSGTFGGWRKNRIDIDSVKVRWDV